MDPVISSFLAQLLENEIDVEQLNASGSRVMNYVSVIEGKLPITIGPV